MNCRGGARPYQLHRYNRQGRDEPLPLQLSGMALGAFSLLVPAARAPAMH